jgi:glucokinase
MDLLGIDIGGTKTSVCVADDRGRIRASERIAMRAREATDAYARRLADLCRAVLRKAAVKLSGIKAIGIAAPGPMNVRKGVLIAPPNNPGWHNVPIVAMVRRSLRRPVFLNNDANACALAEACFGGHRGARNLIYLTFSTGMGGGIIANGELVQGCTDAGGEVGHQVLDPEGPECGCGQRGCWEAYVGGRRVAERLRQRIRDGKLRTGMIEMAGGDIGKIDLPILAAAARAGDPLAVEEWDRFTERAAHGIGNLIMCLNPEVIVLGTIAIHAGDFLLAPVRQKLARYAWPWPLKACRIVPSALGDRIGDLSAVAVALAGLKGRPEERRLRMTQPCAARKTLK